MSSRQRCFTLKSIWIDDQKRDSSRLELNYPLRNRNTENGGQKLLFNGEIQ